MPLLWVQLSMFWISSSHLGGVLRVFKKCWKYAIIALNKHRLNKIQLFDNTVVLGSGQFNTHIIFRNVEMFNFFLETFFLKENKESDGIFVNISFVEIESSKLINYLTNMCWSDKGTMLELCYFYIVHLFLAANFIMLAWVLLMHTMGLQCSKLSPWGTWTE